MQMLRNYASPVSENAHRMLSLAIVQDIVSIVLGKIVADALIELQIAPASLERERKLKRHRRATDDCQRGALFEIDGGVVQRAEQRCAHWTWTVAFRPIHPEIGNELVVPAEHVGQSDRLALLIEQRVILVMDAVNCTAR